MNGDDTNQPGHEQPLQPMEQGLWVQTWLAKNLAGWEAKGVDPRVLSTVLLTVFVMHGLRIQPADDIAEWLEAVAAALRVGEVELASRPVN